MLAGGLLKEDARPTPLVLGYDGSDCSTTALARTIDLAGALPDATVVVVYAFEFSIGYVPIGMTDSPLMMSAEFDDHAQLVRSYGEGQVKKAVEKLAAAGVKAEKAVSYTHLTLPTNREVEISVVAVTIK